MSENLYNHNQAETMSLEQLQNLYEKYLRQISLKEIRQAEKEQLIQQPFFAHFREPVLSDHQQADTDPSSPLFKEYLSFKKTEQEKQQQQLLTLKNEFTYEDFFLNWEKNLDQTEESLTFKSNDYTRYHVDQKERLKTEIKQVIQHSPEAWETYYQQQWLKDIDNLHQQRLVSVPYVQQTKEKMLKALKQGTPIYVVGHLGSGKTQLAIEVATDFIIQRKIQQKLETALEEWFTSHPKASKEEVLTFFKKMYQVEHTHYIHLLTHGSKEEIAALRPLFISGSHNLTYEDMFVEKTLTLEQTFQSQSFSDYLNTLATDYNQWLTEHDTYLNHLTADESLQLKIQVWKSFSDLFIAKNSSFGTTIQKMDREILLAIKQGRPVIVDELNTIAMQNLIALNDILQRHAGQTAYITGVGPVYIHPGFGFIGTGNLSTDLVSYEGTNQLNPAFQSRFLTIEYNYVPQQLTGDLTQQEQPEKNELFRIMLATLANPNGTLQLPNAKQSLAELFRFAQLSRLTQHIFMGKWIEDEKGETMSHLELRESVLSIRNIIRVLDEWNLGEEKDLSQALWEGFISSITYPDDQNYILSQAVRLGFFQQADGWCVATKATGEGLTTYDEIREYPYHYVRPTTETLSYLDVIQLIFGNQPARTSVPLTLQEHPNFKETKPMMTLKNYQKLDQELSQIEYSQFLWQFLTEDGDKL
ncbi:hypothetical protein [Vagococcus humatus]|nr:hypothetical protein [Vagococcus humatus]